MAGRRYTRGMRLWSVIYPVFLYFAVCQILSVVQLMLPFTSGLDAVIRQGVDTLGGLLVLCASFLRQGRSDESRFGAAVLKEGVGGQFFSCLIAALMLGCGSFALNNLIALTSLMERSDGYRFVEQSFYSSGLVWEIAVLCILTPVTEELLYRRIVFCELRGWMGRWGAIFVSALLFGVMHMNIVQTLYAFGLGILLGILMECCGIYAAMCGHIMANLLSVLRSERGLFSGLEKGSEVYWLVTLAALALTAGLVFWCALRMRSGNAAGDFSRFDR